MRLTIRRIFGWLRRWSILASAGTAIRVVCPSTSVAAGRVGIVQGGRM
jgi:hypothetical protein